MISFILLTVAVYFMANLIGYWVHRGLHKEWTRKAYRDHFHHHWKIYPPSDYLSNEYREPPLGAGQAKYYITLVALLFAPVAFLSGWIYMFVLAEALAILKLNAYVHDALHVRGHWLERFATFHRWRTLHFEHHVDDVNFGIIDFTADRLFGTMHR